MLAGCSLVMDDSMPDCRDESQSDVFTLSFSINTSALTGGSRSDDKGHGEVESEMPDFEDCIDAKDCALFVFAKTQGTEGQESLLLKITDLATSTNPGNSITGGSGAYTVNYEIAKDLFIEKLGINLSSDRSKRVELRVMLLANASSSVSDTPDDWSNITGTTYSEVVDQINQIDPYSMSYIYNNDDVTGEAINIYRNQKQAIPMFGTMKITVSVSALANTRTDSRFYMGEMDLLRSIAKVRVVDNIQNKDVDGYPKIVGASILGSQSNVRPLPADALNYVNGTQVHVPNIPAQTQTPGITAYKLGTIPDSRSMTPPSERTGSTWIGFVPEQRIGNVILSNYSQDMPVIHVDVAVSQNVDGTDNVEGYNIPMTGYNGKSFSFGDNVLRNHIYTLSVNQVSGDLKVSVDVVPYRGCTLEPFFGLDPDYYKSPITEIWKTAQVEAFRGTWDGGAPNWNSTDNIMSLSNTRFATVSNGKLYTVDQRTMSIAEITEEGTLVPTYRLPKPANAADYYGTAIAADEVGNFLIGMNFTLKPSSSTKFAIYNPSSGECKEFNLSVPAGWTVGRLDCIGRVLGDLTKDAIFTIVPEKGYTSEVRIINVTGNGTLESVTMTDLGNIPVAGNYTQQNIAVPACHTMAEAKVTGAVKDFYYSSCDGTNNYYASYIGGIVTSDFAPKMLTVTKAGTNGFDTFVVDGKRYFVRNWSSKAGDLTMNIVVMDADGKSVARWENKSYVLDGGYSTIITVPLEDNTVDIYVFNSGNTWGAAAKLNFNPAQVH